MTMLKNDKKFKKLKLKNFKNQESQPKSFIKMYEVAFCKFQTCNYYFSLQVFFREPNISFPPNELKIRGLKTTQKMIN